MNDYRRWLVAVFLLLVVMVTSHAQEQLPPNFAQAEERTVEVLNEYPHDTLAFTQGLLLYEGRMFESTGQYDRSSLREVDVTTGEVLRIIPVTRSEEELSGENPPRNYFAEGLERVGDRLIQLTWQSEVAFVYDLETFELVDTIEYEGQGWGLCTDGSYLYMSDSTQYLTVREVDSFEVIARMVVTLNGRPIQAQLLNELECVGEYVYANLWQTDFIAQIDKTNGNILALIDASGLLTQEERLEAGADVLNGIAYNPENDTFYITGKDWPSLFEVRFVPVESSGASG